MLDNQTKYCNACGKRLPRWGRRRGIRSDRQFCSDACRKAWARLTDGGSPGKVVRDKAKEVPVPQGFAEPVLRTDLRPREVIRACRACGGKFITAAERQHCSARCAAYVPPAPRLPDGRWHIVTGPVDYCVSCELAIVPGPGSLLVPHRRAGELYCRACAPKRATATSFTNGRRPCPAVLR